MAGWYNMEESQEEWKGYIIVKDGPYWKVRNNTRYIGGTFTMLAKARAWIDATIIENQSKEFKTALRRIRKIKDLKERSKEYKKLCQTVKSM